MSYFVRNVQLPQDYDSIANLLNTILSEDTNSEELAAEDAKIPTTGSLYLNADGQLSGFDRHRIVAVNAQGKAAGYGISWRAPWTAAGELNQTLAADPAYRGHGIGSMLYEQLEAWAVQNGASRLNIEVRDDDKHSIRFAERWGYQVERHTFESVLDLNLFDTSRLSWMDREVHIVPLSELDVAVWEEKLYELYKETSYDIPGFSGDFFNFDDWKKWTLQLPGSKPEHMLLACDEDQLMGMAHLLYYESTNSMYHEYTGVKKEYRCKGIGKTLKLRTIELAIQQGISYMRTHNDSLNRPMLKINRDELGFKAVPGNYKMIKKL